MCVVVDRKLDHNIKYISYYDSWRKVSPGCCSDLSIRQDTATQHMQPPGLPASLHLLRTPFVSNSKRTKYGFTKDNAHTYRVV